MKKVLGGNTIPEIEDDGISGGTTCYRCCPNGDASSSMCSDKVTVKSGETASCSMGTLTKVSC